MAGVPGFEPGMPGSKPGALPLGDTPSGNSTIDCFKMAGYQDSNLGMPGSKPYRLAIPQS